MRFARTDDAASTAVVAAGTPSERAYIERNTEGDSIDDLEASIPPQEEATHASKNENVRVVEEDKPVMPRAKRVISFDDQTSRLSRSKLIIV